jgi:hypothetical protein
MRPLASATPDSHKEVFAPKESLTVDETCGEWRAYDLACRSPEVLTDSEA